MSDIERIDRNFEINTDIKRDGIVFYDIDSAPFKIYGVFRESGCYRRMPEDVAKKVSDGVYYLHTNTAGGRVRFVTDSSYIAICAVMDRIDKMPHFALSGSSGFDIYDENGYINTFVPPYDVSGGYSMLIDLNGRVRREITINFPLYSNVNKLYIGLDGGATLEEASDYRYDKPIVYYGSSITQGGCASRPGMSYQAIVSRVLDTDYINLGFSGNARAEDEMIKYIVSLDMSVFVLDYDHNAPTCEHLKATHEKAFCQIRQRHPDIPIILMSRPKHDLTDDELLRLDIIKETYNNARINGDNNVYLIDGYELTRLCGGEGTVDNCHPTDLGFFSMAEALLNVLKDII